MSSSTTVIAVVEPDHTVKVPPGLAIGAKVLVVPMPSMMELLQDTARRARFAASRRAIGEATRVPTESHSLSDEAVVSLVQRARRAPRTDQP